MVTNNIEMKGDAFMNNNYEEVLNNILGELKNIESILGNAVQFNAPFGNKAKEGEAPSGTPTSGATTPSDSSVTTTATTTDSSSSDSSNASTSISDTTSSDSTVSTNVSDATNSTTI